MLVRTLRKHGNSHAPKYVKNFGRKYELPGAEAERLIAAGLVAEVAAAIGSRVDD